MCFYAVFLPEDDPNGSKLVVLINTTNLVAFVILV
jgi:hypothetical protein